MSYSYRAVACVEARMATEWRRDGYPRTHTPNALTRACAQQLPVAPDSAATAAVLIKPYHKHTRARARTQFVTQTVHSWAGPRERLFDFGHGSLDGGEHCRCVRFCEGLGVSSTRQ